MSRKSIRKGILDKDLIAYNPARWKLNIPGRSYPIRAEDLVPALSGAIGKASLVAAFAMAWASGLGITDLTIVAESVRLEIIISSLFALLFSALFIPTAGPPGTLAPLIPPIPLMASAGVHPLSFNVLTGLIVIFFAYKGYFTKIATLNGPGTKAGILLLFGVMGIINSYQKLQAWTGEDKSFFSILIAAGALVYIGLAKLNLKWLVIPACGLIAILFSMLNNVMPSFQTDIGLPIVSPSYWWKERWGVGYGFSPKQVLAAVPFALVAVTMLPMDALASRTMQETNYPAAAKTAVIDLDATFIIVGFRNVIGAVLGGIQTSAVWRSFLIPLAGVKRPIGGSAFFLALFGIAFGLLGFPIDLSVFPPLVWLVLIYGVFTPMAMTGISLIRNAKSFLTALVCLVAGLSVSPILGWGFALLLENLLFANARPNNRALKRDRLLSAALFFIAVLSYILML